jgi:Putative DNA-binding domain
MRLAELQRELQRDLLGHDSAIATVIVDAPPLPVQSRLGIYRNAYRARLIEALGEVYPVLYRLLGDETFESLGTLFVDAYPSEHRSIRWYGRELAVFLAATSPFADQPILSEVARLEWALSEVFDAADAGVMDRASLEAVDPEHWATLCFGFHPSVRRLTLAWNTVAVWQAVSDEHEPGDPERSPEPVQWLLWRRNFKNYFRSLDADERAALDAAAAGRSFTEICETLTAHLPATDIPLRAAMLVATWVDSGLIVSPGPAPAPTP